MQLPAEPKSIAELKYYGLSVLPVIKGKDSILYGIKNNHLGYQ
jgi:phage terminase large subunit